MNLVQVQEHLKGMPTQAVMAYANGQNPQVPPYIALGELNRRKQMEQPQAQPATGSVKEQIEQSLMQPQQLPGLAAQGVPVPQMPQPQGIPSQMPQQLASAGPQQAPTRMAGGGLTSVPVRKDMFNYAPGGIVAFANEDNDQVVQEPKYDEATQEKGLAELQRLRDKADEVTTTERKPSPPQKDDMTAVLRAAMEARMPEMKTRAERMAEAAQRNPELLTRPEAGLGALLTKLEASQQAARERATANEGRQGLADISNALIAAGEATRGQRGSGAGMAFGAFGKSYNAATAAAAERQAKRDELQQQQDLTMAKLRYEMDEKARAHAEGNVDKEMQHDVKIAELKNKFEDDKRAAAAELLRDQRSREEHAAANALRSKQIEAIEDAKPSKEDKLLTTVMSRVNSDPAIKGLADAIKQGAVQPGTPEYNTLINNISKLSEPYYKAAGLTPPPPAALAEEAAAPQKKGFWASLFGGGSSAPAAQPNVVDFSKLPK